MKVTFTGGDTHGMTRGKRYPFRGDCEECLSDAYEHQQDGGLLLAPDLMHGWRLSTQRCVGPDWDIYITQIPN